MRTRPRLILDSGMARLMLKCRRMVWMEMIRLRTSLGRVEDAGNLLLAAVQQAIGEGGLVKLRVYSSVSSHTDLALSLVWNTSSLEQPGSRAGLSISELLKGFGLVDHSVWVEREAE